MRVAGVLKIGSVVVFECGEGRQSGPNVLIRSSTVMCGVNKAKHPAIKVNHSMILLYLSLIMPPPDTTQSTFHAPEDFLVPPGFV